jgi:hypothetical protein
VTQECHFTALTPSYLQPLHACSTNATPGGVPVLDWNTIPLGANQSLLESLKATNASVSSSLLSLSTAWLRSSLQGQLPKELRGISLGGVVKLSKLSQTSCPNSMGQSQGCGDADVAWHFGPWGQCSASCGGGLRAREAVCILQTSGEMKSRQVQVRADLIPACSHNLKL